MYLSFRRTLPFLLSALLFAGYNPCAVRASTFPDRLVQAALQIVDRGVVYDPAYRSIPYPGGDVPAGRGVCTDVVIRAYRKLGIDLQQLVHEDMRRARSAYPNSWGAGKIDPNIDHRRVPNLMAFFKRHGTVQPITNNIADYLPGDIVCWDLGRGLTHIGIVVPSPTGGRPWIVHNIGGGQVAEDVLFKWKVIGHYRYGW